MGGLGGLWAVRIPGKQYYKTKVLLEDLKAEHIQYLQVRRQKHEAEVQVYEAFQDTMA